MRLHGHPTKDTITILRSYTLIRALRIAREGGDIKELEKPALWTRQYSSEQIIFNPLLEK